VVKNTQQARQIAWYKFYWNCFTKWNVTAKTTGSQLSSGQNSSHVWNEDSHQIQYSFSLQQSPLQAGPPSVKLRDRQTPGIINHSQTHDGLYLSFLQLCTKFGEYDFVYAGTFAWYTLTEDLHAVTDPGLYRKQLKTHFFSSAFDVCWRC